MVDIDPPHRSGLSGLCWKMGKPIKMGLVEVCSLINPCWVHNCFDPEEPAWPFHSVPICWFDAALRVKYRRSFFGVVSKLVQIFYHGSYTGCFLESNEWVWCVWAFPLSTLDCGLYKWVIANIYVYGYVENVVRRRVLLVCAIMFLWGGVQSNLGMHMEIYLTCGIELNEKETFADDTHDIQLRLSVEG